MARLTVKKPRHSFLFTMFLLFLFVFACLHIYVKLLRIRQYALQENFNESCPSPRQCALHEHPLFHRGPILFRIPQYTKECTRKDTNLEVEDVSSGDVTYIDPLKTGEFDSSYDLGKYMCYAVMPTDTVAMNVNDVTKCAQEHEDYNFYAVQDGICYATKVNDIKASKREGNTDVASSESCIVYKKKDYSDYNVEIIS